MKKPFFCLILIVLLVSSCAMGNPFRVSTRYGDRIRYGEGEHPGIDFDISIGTPIIASADGVIHSIGEQAPTQWYGGGLYVEIWHGETFHKFYKQCMVI